MTGSDPLIWHRAKGQTSSAGVGVAAYRGEVLMRNLTNPDGSILAFTPEEFAAFLREAKKGTYGAHSSFFARLRRRLTARGANAAARLAAKLAGRKRSYRRNEWLAELAQARSEGSLTHGFAVRIGTGYIRYALQLRAVDLRSWCRRRLEFIVISPLRTHFTICLLLGAWVIKIFVDQGLDGVTGDLVNFGLAWTALGAGANKWRSRLDSAEKPSPRGPGGENSKKADPPNSN